MSTDNARSSRLSGKVAIVSGAGTYGGRGVGNGAAAAILFAHVQARASCSSMPSASGLMRPGRS